MKTTVSSPANPPAEATATTDPTGRTVIACETPEPRPTRRFMVTVPTDQAPDVPATFRPANPHDAHPWCTVTDPAADCSGVEIGLDSPEGHGLTLLTGYLDYDAEDDELRLVYGRGDDDWHSVTSGQLRAETAEVRAHLVRLDTLADQYDTLTAESPAGAQHPTAAYIAERGEAGPAGRELANVLTAAVRGPEWMTRYGCTPNCVLDHAGEDGENGWHQGADVEVPAPGRYGSDLPDEEPEPLFAARVTTVNGSPDIFGVTTKLWVDVPGDTMELTLPEVDQFISGLEGFLPGLRALRAELAEVSTGDRPENPEALARWRAEQNARADAERARIAAEAKKPALPRIVAPTRFEDAAAVTAPGAAVALLKAYLHTPAEIDGTPTGAPRRLAVFSEGAPDADLDLAGARALFDQVFDFAGKLAAMLQALSADEQDGDRR